MQCRVCARSCAQPIFCRFWSTMTRWRYQPRAPSDRAESRRSARRHSISRPIGRAVPSAPARAGVRRSPLLSTCPPATGAPVLVAAFAGLLHRYTNEETVPLGFVATDGSARLVRIDFADTPSFEAVVAQARAAIDAPASGALPQVVLALDADPPNDVAEQDLWLAVDTARQGGDPRLRRRSLRAGHRRPSARPRRHAVACRRPRARGTRRRASAPRRA